MSDSQAAYSEISNLIKRFKNMPAASRKSMNEHATRQGFILPMFRALGWDTDNVDEVSPEEKVSRGWVDFSLRIGGVPRYFLETKRADEDLNDPRWVRQAIDYAWTKSVTWALLSDFEGLMVFNAEWKETNPFRARFLEFNLDTYLSDFERLWWLSREQTSIGKLSDEAEKVGRVSKRLPVNIELFSDLKQWRQILFKDLKAYNPILSPPDIDAAILLLLNRLIFIRTAEDRQVEPRRLLALVRELKEQNQYRQLAANLSKLFREMDRVYNSELFAQHFSEGLDITPGTLEEVIQGLYEKDFVQYNFNALDADVLGTVYEQYLGSVVADKSEEESRPKRAAKQPALIPEGMTVQERRMKRKEQGIYYTPSFVTKYIVQHTVGKYLQECGYDPSKPPRILDMACGSASFLIEAFDTVDGFVAKQRGQAHIGEVDQRDRARQVEVLRSCIFGVDRDKQAVDVARLNLLLRALHSREKLPMLESIHHADSLHDEIWRMAFPNIVEEGGFDAVIGNPPYVRAENMARIERDFYMAGGFETAYGRFDIFILFLERAIKLLKEGGRLGFIVPYSVLNENYAKMLRAFILRSCAMETIVDLSEYKVFQDATIATCIFILRKESAPSVRAANQVKVIRQQSYDDGIDEQAEPSLMIGQSIFETTPLNSFRLDFDAATISIVEKVDRQSVKVGDLCYVITGAVLHDPKTGESKERLIHTQSQRGLKPYIEAKEIARYQPPISRRFLEYRVKEVHRPKFPELFENNKIMVQMVAGDRGLIGTYDEHHLYTDHSLHLCVMKSYLFGVKRSQIKITEDEAQFARPYDPRFLLGHINSRLADFYFRRKLEGGLNIYPETVRQLPIRRIDFTKPVQKAAHDGLVELVQKMLTLQKERQALDPGRHFDEIRDTDKQIATVDAEIDGYVYKLYGLTKDEKNVIETG